MDKFKLAIIVDTCMAGGVSKALNDFIKCLSQTDLEITLFVKKFDTVKNFYLPDGVKCCPWPDKKRLPKVLKNKFLELLNKRNYQRSIVYNAEQYNSIEDEFDCVIGYQMISNDVTVMTLDKINAKRKVLWLHGKKKFSKNNMKFFDNLYSKADMIVAVSKDTEERFKTLMPKSVNKTTTIHNFYDFDLIEAEANKKFNGFDKNDNEIVIVSTGRISKEKGFDRVPEVTQKLVNDGHNIQWYVVGDGAMLSEVNENIKNMGLQEHIHMVGYKNNPYPYVKYCDIYVQPSYTEGFCTSTMEAKILKRPVVTTDVPGMNEQFVNEYDGLIVESSVDGLYNGIKLLIEDKHLYESIVQNLEKQTLSNEEEVQKALKVIKG